MTGSQIPASQTCLFLMAKQSLHSEQKNESESMPLGIIQGGLCFSYAIVSLQLKNTS